MTTNLEEQQYLNLLQTILDQGDEHLDRTNVGTYSVFAQQLKFNLRDNTIPLLTTKRIYWKGVVHELLMFIKGISNNKYLQDRKVHIWDGNTSRDFLDSRGLTDLKEGDLGANYGFQWRHFGAEYRGFDKDYTNQGVDQLKNAIDLIKNNPTSRRIIVSAWNPAAQHRMSLPSCHCWFQFYVNQKHQELHCQMYQRSVDSFLGLPFNIASYSLLTHIVAQITGLKAGTLTMCLGDTHIYKNHVEQCKLQLSRDVREFPKLKILNHHDDIDDYEFDDFELIGYKPHKSIKAKMAV